MPSTFSHKLLVAALALACALVAAPAAGAQTAATSGGGASYVPPPPPPAKGALVDGRLVAPASAPRRIKRVIRAANRIVEMPYEYGGGHQPFAAGLDSGYDCSGSVSWALHGGRFLGSPLPSGALMSWARSGPGRWLTVYANGGHAYLVVAGYRFDTSMHDADAPGPATGPRWSRTLRRSSTFVARHPRGY
jgi:hypothetical protein